MSQAWLRAWWENSGRSRPLRLLWCGPDPRRWSCALPLVESRRACWRVWRAPGTGSQRFTPPGFAGASPDTLASAAAALARCRRWDWLQLDRMPAAIAANFAAALRSHTRCCHLSAPELQRFVPLRRPWPEICADMNPSLRKQAERQQLRLERLGPLHFEVHDSAATALPCFELCLRLEASGWKGQAGTAMLSQPAAAAFYRALVAELARARQLRLFLLRSGANAVAFDLCCLAHGALAGIKIGYDHGWGKYSPGHVLMLRTLQHAHQEGLDEYDFLGADEPRKAAWTPHTRQLVRLTAFHSTLRGRALAFAHANRLRRWRRPARLVPHPAPPS